MTQCRNHFAGNNLTCRNAQLFAQGNTHGRSSLYNDNFFWIVDCIPNLVCIILFHDSACRADISTLAAVGAGTVEQIMLKGCRYHGVEATAGKAVNTHTLHITANTDAATTENAFFLVAHQRRIAVINSTRPCFATIEAELTHAQVSSNFLQLAVAVLLAAQAVLRVIGQKQLQYCFTRFAYFGSISFYYHTLAYRIYAGGNQSTRTAGLYHTQATGTLRTQVRMIAQCRNINTCAACSLQNTEACRGLNLFSIYCQINHLHLQSPPYALLIALNGHAVMQAPHLMHLFWSITCFVFGEPLIACTGH